MRIIIRGTLVAVAAFTIIATTEPATLAAVTVTEFTVPTGGSSPNGIAMGPDGNLWFAEQFANKVGMITTLGLFIEITVPTASSFPIGIAAGPDGNVWFTEANGNKIGRVTTHGLITDFAVPTAGSFPTGITAGPDGNLWFAEQSGSKIGRITTAGVVTEFTVPTAGSYPSGIAAGPDGALWFTEYNGGKIGRITTAGVIHEFTVPTAGGGPENITAGPDGNLWFAEYGGNKIGRITTGGAFTEFPVPTANSNPSGIAVGLDGNVWFTEFNTNNIGRVPLYKPDTRLGVNAGVPVGNNVHNLTGAGQTLTTIIQHGGGVKTDFIGIQNDGPASDSFTVRGAPGNANFKIQYLNGATDVTAQVVAGTFSTGALARGATFLIRAKITARTPLAGQSGFLYVISTSVADTGAKDLALIRARSN